MKQSKRVTNALDAHGFELVRSAKHRVYMNGAGKTLVMPSTPSDHRAEQNILRDIRNVAAGTWDNLVPAGDTGDTGITLMKMEKKRLGNGNGGTKTNGTGFVYDPPKRILTTEEQREADRLRTMQDRVIDRCRAAQLAWEHRATLLLQVAYNTRLLGIVRDSIAASMKKKWHDGKDAERRQMWRTSRLKRNAIMRIYLWECPRLSINLAVDSTVPFLVLTNRAVLNYEITCDGGDKYGLLGTMTKQLDWVLGLWRDLLLEEPKPNWMSDCPAADVNLSEEIRRAVRFTKQVMKVK
jgi:hypothetical protein